MEGSDATPRLYFSVSRSATPSVPSTLRGSVRLHLRVRRRGAMGNKATGCEDGSGRHKRRPSCTSRAPGDLLPVTSCRSRTCGLPASKRRSCCRGHCWTTTTSRFTICCGGDGGDSQIRRPRDPERNVLGVREAEAADGEVRSRREKEGCGRGSRRRRRRRRRKYGFGARVCERTLGN